jgi:hypothetical protein
LKELKEIPLIKQRREHMAIIGSKQCKIPPPSYGVEMDKGVN